MDGEKQRGKKVMDWVFLLISGVLFWMILVVDQRVDGLRDQIWKMQGREKHHPTEPARWNETK